VQVIHSQRLNVRVHKLVYFGYDDHFSAPIGVLQMLKIILYMQVHDFKQYFFYIVCGFKSSEHENPYLNLTGHTIQSTKSMLRSVERS
jgi:hypothetical protein